MCLVFNTSFLVRNWLFCCTQVYWCNCAAFNCPAGDNGPFADSLNCGSFYLCVGDKAYHMPCAPGLYFNPDTKRCDFAFNVTCASTATEIPLICKLFIFTALNFFIWNLFNAWYIPIVLSFNGIFTVLLQHLPSMLASFLRVSSQTLQTATSSTSVRAMLPTAWPALPASSSAWPRRPATTRTRPTARMAEPWSRLSPQLVSFSFSLLHCCNIEVNVLFLSHATSCWFLQVSRAQLVFLMDIMLMPQTAATSGTAPTPLPITRCVAVASTSTLSRQPVTTLTRSTVHRLLSPCLVASRALRLLMLCMLTLRTAATSTRALLVLPSTCPVLLASSSTLPRASVTFLLTWFALLPPPFSPLQMQMASRVLPTPPIHLICTLILQTASTSTSALTVWQEERSVATAPTSIASSKSAALWRMFCVREHLTVASMLPAPVLIYVV